MGTLRITKSTGFLGLGRDQQKQYDLRSWFSQDTSSYLVARCISPEHTDDTPSLAIYHDAAYCRGCGHFWWPDEFLRELGDRSLDTETTSTLSRHAAVPASDAVARTFSQWLTERDGPYESRLPLMYARGLRRDTLVLNQIGHNGEGFSIPIYQKKDLVTIRYRRDDERAPDRPKYWGTAGFNAPLLYAPLSQGWKGESPRRPILVEGELDALRLSQEGYRAVAITNGAQALSRTVASLITEVKAMGTEWLLCGDKDQVGLRAMRDVATVLRSNGVEAAHVIWAPSLGKDVTDFLNRWPVSQFDQYVRGAERCVFDSSSDESTR